MNHELRYTIYVLNHLYRQRLKDVFPFKTYITLVNTKYLRIITDGHSVAEASVAQQPNCCGINTVTEIDASFSTIHARLKDYEKAVQMCNEARQLILEIGIKFSYLLGYSSVYTTAVNSWFHELLQKNKYRPIHVVTNNRTRNDITLYAYTIPEPLENSQSLHFSTLDDPKPLQKSTGICAYELEHSSAELSKRLHDPKLWAEI